MVKMLPSFDIEDWTIKATFINIPKSVLGGLIPDKNSGIKAGILSMAVRKFCIASFSLPCYINNEDRLEKSGGRENEINT